MKEILSSTVFQFALLEPVSRLAFFSREQATKIECDWVVMTTAFVVSQSGCFFLRSREQIRLVENRLYAMQNHCFCRLFIVCL
jgi:hypothetical protein